MKLIIFCLFLLLTAPAPKPTKNESLVGRYLYKDQHYLELFPNKTCIHCFDGRIYEGTWKIHKDSKYDILYIYTYWKGFKESRTLNFDIYLKSGTKISYYKYEKLVILR